MKFFICPKTNKIYTECHEKIDIRCFVEYGSNYENINIFPFDDMEEKNKLIETNIHYEHIFLMPFSNLTLFWNIVNRLFIFYKHIKTKKIESKIPYIIFFNHNKNYDFYNLENEKVIFDSLRFNKKSFFKLHNIFQENKMINVYKFEIPKNPINYNHEPLFSSFKRYVLDNLNIKHNYDNVINDVKKRKIIFSIKKNNMEIVNLNEMKEWFKGFNIEYVNLDEYSIIDKIKMAANTDIMIGVRHDDLNCCCFMKNNSRVIELMPNENCGSNHNHLLSNISNLKYWQIIVGINKGNIKEYNKAKFYLTQNNMNEIINLCSRI